MAVQIGQGLATDSVIDSSYENNTRDDNQIQAKWIDQRSMLRDAKKRDSIEVTRSKMMKLFSRFEKEIPVDLLKYIYANLRILIINNDEKLFDLYYSLESKQEQIIEERLAAELGKPTKLAPKKDPLEELL